MSDLTLLHQDADVLGVLFFNEVVVASDTDEELVAAPGAGKKLKIVQLVVVAGDTPSTVLLESGTATPVAGTFDFGANGGVVLPFNPAGWFQCGDNAALTATTGAGSNTVIMGAYAVVQA